MVIVVDKLLEITSPRRRFGLNMWLALLLTSLFTFQASSQNVLISFYYETLCPDSSYFIEYHLYPAWSILKQNLTVEWIPFGKATYLMKDGEWIFDCQHGEKECEGNKLHACALEKLSREQSVNFILCSMTSSFPPESGHKCAEDVGANFTEINDCFSGKEGNDLLFKHGNKTMNLDPILNTVPTYTINGNTTDWYDRDFLTNLCAEYLPTVEFCTRLLKRLKLS